MPYLEVRHGQVHQNSVPSKCGETIQTLLASPRNVREECPLLNFREHHDSSEASWLTVRKEQVGSYLQEQVGD
ncbi:unnamed protein product [Fusarium venenatum]|uniref:Uncharacterized protein n=1 Tax=Fusarium venenatum TaxID=56646 RepID=A0A2L2TD00_9HYPO|nr:uncharacterized protein FVRRES_12113 [Fusarium venenatum]CEI39422.1 unnamed protein product [Fusarium venenatum]